MNEITEKWEAAKHLVTDGKLSIIMPVHNLQDVITDNIKKVYSVFTGILPFEIIVVDDGSTDNTSYKIKDIAKSLKDIKPVILKINSGKGAALKNGFDASKGNYIMFLDGDLDLPPDQSYRLFDVMKRTSADVVIGSKRHPESIINYPFTRRIMSSIYYFLVKLLIGLPLKDTQTGIKLFKRDALEYALARMLVKEFAFDLEMLAIIHQHGFKIAESPVMLDFGTKWGYFKPQAIKNIIKDTLAIFYRIKLLNYYQSIASIPIQNSSIKFSIIIACPAHSSYLDECIDGILAQKYDNYEVIILPDNPTKINLPCKFIEIPTGKIRPAEKRNIGIRKASGDVIAFIDDDAFPFTDWLSCAAIYFSDPSIAGVGGPASTPDNESYFGKLSGKVLENRLVSGNYRYRYLPDRVRTSEDIPSCNLFVRKNTLDELGGFRIDFWPGEDTFLCLEITKLLNKKLIYDPRIHVCHHRRKLFLPHLRQIGRYALHRGYFAKRYPQTSRRISYALPSFFVIGLTCGIPVLIFLPALFPIYASAVGFYLSITLIWAFELNPISWFLVWAGIISTHIFYGIKFMMGLCSLEMPNQNTNFDHPSESISVRHSK